MCIRDRTKHDKRIILFGGIRENMGPSEDIIEIEIDPLKSQKLSTKGVGPGKRFDHSAVSQGENLFIFGGNGQCDTNVYRLNLVSLTWTKIITLSPNQPLLQMRHGHSAEMIEDKMIIFGGNVKQGNRKTIWGCGPLFEDQNDLLIFDTVTEEWTILPDKIEENNSQTLTPSKRSYHASTTYKSHMLITGGTNQTDQELDIWCLNINTMKWKKISALKQQPSRSRHTTTIYKDKLYLLGGSSPQMCTCDGCMSEVCTNLSLVLDCIPQLTALCSAIIITNNLNIDLLPKPLKALLLNDKINGD